MHVYVVFAHPSHRSFTYAVLQAFLRGLEDAGHSHELGDLYAMNFQSDMDPAQYDREVGMVPTAPVPEDVAAEHAKIDRAGALAFVYPVWWSDCPAKLKGWFDRVWTYGYAYTYEGGEHLTHRIDIAKALVLCPAGHPIETLEANGIAGSMRCVMLNDRLRGVGVADAEMVILGNMVSGDPAVREANLQAAYRLGREF
ncbi:MAG: NAD(P)H-dependent oxidoreductase [Anaerolineae bacterium]|nr:NAD(P)H-dependent oxidoreductase [Anaerolineae bacterium]